jgi:succinoglycan biosynthesis transport protein ExoP
MSDDAPAPRARRRRWPRIAAFLLLVALMIGAIVWEVRPKTITATALFEVRRVIPSLAGDRPEQSRSQSDYEILKKTQVALLKSKFLLTSALRDPHIGGSPVFAGVIDPEEWLKDHLDVDYPENGELLAISIRGPASQANDLRLVVDAVAEAYVKEVISKEKLRKLTIRDMLEHSLQNLNAEIKRKYEDYLDIAKGMGKPTDGNEFQRQLDLKRMDRIDEELAQLEREQLKIENGGDKKDSKFVAARIEQLRKRQTELQKEVQIHTEKSVVLETQGEELKQLQQIANDMCVKLEKMDVDAQLPAPIQQVQQAVVEPAQVAAQ